VSADFVTKIGLMTHAHTHPYYIWWLNNSGKAKVTHTARVQFSIGTYHDYADCNVVPMQSCSLLLGRPSEFDTDVVHHGRSNKYTLMHNGKKIILLSLTPNEIV
jgi:endoglucanase Acf2